MDERDIAKGFLFARNCNPKYLGYYYAQEVLSYLMKHKLPAGKVMLRSVADKFNTSAENVNRCVRTFIDVSWNYFEFFKTKPTCKEFFAMCVEYLRS